ncbi:phosphotransferase family protein [Nocardioides seonyuensis]|uniref:Phosphotransferase family protein n=1 Tax=Nocardioides seonyuensis TaxID=2518371 RepID=A0A4P7IJ64_9ACTN|nr:phosphotransferase family protein [Nocardioides seonyuensis]QBX55921.1 phosphotransferase family protein [Nocardioides seonyuensis]
MRRVSAHAEVTELGQLEGGVSSLTYSCLVADSLGERQVVLKIAPPGLAPVHHRDVLRQARVLRLLAGLPGFPVPGVVFEDGGDPPDVPPMFGMELRAGDAYEPGLDMSANPPAPDVAAERMLAAARALGVLQTRTPDELGVGEEPVSAVQDELDRWERLFSTVDADIAPGHQDLYRRLSERVPRGIEPRMLHGDYRLANMLFVGRDLEAVIDWEIWSVGDPRFDLAWLLMHLNPRHVFHEDRSDADVAACSALPSAQAIIDEYVSTRRGLGADEGHIEAVTTGLEWFVGVGFYKVASTIAAIYKRERKLPQPTPKLEVAARHLPGVLEAGHSVLDTV